MIDLATIILVLVSLQRLSELVLANRNTARLRAMGAIEKGADHYPVMIALHLAWIVGLWIFARHQEVNLVLLALYGVVQIFRGWNLWSLGRRWTTRIMVVPGETLVARGPYRFIRHPNYVVVAIEMPLLPLVFGLWQFALLFAVLNFAMLAWRIRVENQALSAAIRS